MIFQKHATNPNLVSHLLTPLALSFVLPQLPPVLQHSAKSLLYSTEHHGVGLMNLLHHCRSRSEPTLLCLKILDSEQVLVVFCSDPWTSDVLARAHAVND
jgi:hypothetical protein